MSELVLPGPSPTDVFDDTKGPQGWKAAGSTNYWDNTKVNDPSTSKPWS